MSLPLYMYFMLQTCLDFYSSILVETPEYNSGNEIQLETTNESYTSPIAQDDQPTYQGLLNDNSEFLSMIMSSCASYNWFPRDQFGLQRNNNNNNNNNNFFFFKK